MFIEGRWVQLVIDSEACEAASSLATRRRRRNFSDTIDRRAERAQNLVLVCEVSSVRHALDGEPAHRTFGLLSDPERRQQSRTTQARIFAELSGGMGYISDIRQNSILHFAPFLSTPFESHALNPILLFTCFEHFFDKVSEPNSMLHLRSFLS